jgi:hypothetical protein
MLGNYRVAAQLVAWVLGSTELVSYGDSFIFNFSFICGIPLSQR